MDSSRVAEIYASGAAQRSYGSGYLIAPGLVLTARHVVAPALDGGSCDVRLLGDFLQGRTDWGAYEPCWSEPSLDLALLRQSQGAAAYAAGAVQFARLTRLQRSEHSPDCVAVGFPRVQRHAGINDTTQVSGKIRTLSMMQGALWQVTVEGAAPKSDEDWKGVSGAALFCAGRLVGVIKQTETCYRDGVLIAQPIDAVFDNAGFRQELGEHGQEGFEIYSVEHDPKPWLALYDLAYLVDRKVPVGELVDAMRSAIKANNATRALICAVPGEPEHQHFDLIDLFRKETMPALFQGKPGFNDIVSIDWPTTAESVPQGLRTLHMQLHELLGIEESCDALLSPMRIAGALNGNDKPRAFYCEIHASNFTAIQRDLAQAWLAEWGKVTAAGLNELVALFLCLIFDPQPPPSPRPWWKWWDAAPQLASLQDFTRQQFGPMDAVRDHGSLRLVRLSKLALCERRHLDEWRVKLAALPKHRWVAEHVPRVRAEVAQDLFPMRALLAALDSLALPPAAGS